MARPSASSAKLVIALLLLGLLLLPVACGYWLPDEPGVSRTPKEAELYAISGHFCEHEYVVGRLADIVPCSPPTEPAPNDGEWRTDVRSARLLISQRDPDRDPNQSLPELASLSVLIFGRGFGCLSDDQTCDDADVLGTEMVYGVSRPYPEPVQYDCPSEYVAGAWAQLHSSLDEAIAAIHAADDCATPRENTTTAWVQTAYFVRETRVDEAECPADGCP